MLTNKYGGTARFLSRAIRPSGLNVTFLDMDAAGEEGIRQAIQEDTKVGRAAQVGFDERMLTHPAHLARGADQPVVPCASSSADLSRRAISSG